MDTAAREAIEAIVRAGDYAQARVMLERLLVEGHPDWGAHAKLGSVLQSGGEHAPAVAHYAEAAWNLVTEAVGRSGGDPDESFEKITTAFGAVIPMVRPARFDAARTLLGRTLDYARIRTEMGVSLLELGDIPSARRSFCEAVEFLPAGADYDEPWLWLTRIEDM